MTPGTQELVKRLRERAIVELECREHSQDTIGVLNEAADAIEALSMDSVSERFLDMLVPSPDGTEWMDPNKRRADRAERVAAKIEALTLALQQERERCAGIAELRAEVAEAAARLDEARLHDITDVHEGRAAIARDIASAIRSNDPGKTG